MRGFGFGFGFHRRREVGAPRCGWNGLVVMALDQRTMEQSLAYRCYYKFVMLLFNGKGLGGGDGVVVVGRHLKQSHNPLRLFHSLTTPQTSAAC